MNLYKKLVLQKNYFLFINKFCECLNVGCYVVLVGLFQPIVSKGNFRTCLLEQVLQMQCVESVVNSLYVMLP